MAFESPIIKTKIGQHDFHKLACGEYCKLGSQYCPFHELNDIRLEYLYTNRWTDVMDKRLAKKNSNNNNNKEQQHYEISFDFENENSGFESINEMQLETQKNQSPFCCWGDGSGFEYDIMSCNLIGPGGPVQSVYDITDYGVKHEVLKHGEWNAWIDKFQYDYRFGRVSDTNAETVLFPNVDNPWMFTEYVFRGVKGEGGVCALDLPQEYIVQPPIYDPQTLQLINGDLQLERESDFDNKYKQSLKNLIDKKKVKQFRQIISWSQLAKFSELDIYDNPELLEQLNSQVKQQSCKDQGVKLYRAKIPVQSVKWGEHGNIPPHTLDMTAPKDWFDAQARGKVKAIYDAHIGSPFYCTQTGVVKWEDKKQASYNSKVTLTQFNSPKKYYSYTYEDDFIELDMPFNNTTNNILTPNSIVFGGSDQDNYCHFGCALCQGSNDNKLRCMYLEGLSESSDEIQIMNGYFGERCLLHNYGINSSTDSSQNTKCPHFVQSQNKRIIATYQSQVTNLYQSNLSGMGIVTNYKDILNYISNLGKRDDLTVTYSIRYEIQRSSKNQAKLNKEPNSRDQFGKGVVILPGTGKYAIDSPENANPFSGGDSNVYNDISVLSFHRFFLSAMHCSSQKYCNQFVGPSQNQGYTVGIKAGGQGQCRYYNYEQNEGSNVGCPYNCPPKRAIQFCNVKKDVKDYINSYMNLYQNMSYYGIWQLDAATEKDKDGNGENTGFFYETLGLYKRETIQIEDNQVEWIVFNDWAVARKTIELSIDDQKTEKIAIIAVKTTVGNDVDNANDNSSVYHGGAALLYDKYCPSGFKVFCELRTEERKKIISVTPWWYNSSSSSSSESSDSSLSSESSDSSSITYPIQIEITVVKCIQGYYWYQPLMNDGSSLGGYYIFDSSVLMDEKFQKSVIENRPKHLHQHIDKNGYWFCRVESFNPVPTTNCVMIDNEQKFIGGWHPEYKDYSKIGPQFLQEIISDEIRQGQGIGDYVHNGDYTPIPQNTSKQGYWVDQSGEYIIDERSTGWDQKIADDQERQGASGGICISLKKSNTVINQSTGESEQPRVVNGAVFANDPAFFWMEKYGKPFKGKYNRATKEIQGGHPWFEDPSKDQRYYAPCIVKDVYLLPTMRPAIHCPKCDYYLSYRYHNIKKCPWCDSDYEFIKGSDGSEYWYQGPYKEEVDENGQPLPVPDDALNAIGTSWEEMWEENCERDEYGNPKEPFPIIKKFFKLNALGNVDVWAPPGSAIKMDAYFWKRPPEISNAHKKQIYHRLGDQSIDLETQELKYLYNLETPESELTLGFPEGVGRFEKVPYLKTEEIRKGDERYNVIKWKQPVGGDKNKLHVIDGMYNPIMPRHMLPEFYDSQDSDQDQGVIAPYSLDTQDGLKSVSRSEIIKIRNAVEPTYAYCSEQIDSGDFPTVRASYNLRTAKDQNIIYQNRRALIKPVVLAHTFGDHDAYQEYFSGDYTYGNVREYFPNGYTWWNMKQVMGGRHSELKGGIYHMDDKNDPQKGFHSKVHFPVRQKETVAKCAISIYGLLPLDKTILKAYLVITPSGVDPSKDPIGRAWNGGPVMYHHYHAMKQDHKGDGAQAHLHGTAGYPEGTYFDKNGDMKHYEVRDTGYMDSQIKLQDESNTNLWGIHSENIEDDRNMYYDDKFIDTMTNLSGLYDMSFYRNVGTPKKSISLQNQEESDTISYYGYDKDSFPSPAGWISVNLKITQNKMQQKYQYIVLNNKKEIIQKYSDSMIWRDMTKEQIEKVIDRNSSVIQFGASDGSDDSRVSYQFTEMNSTIYGDLIPNQSQGIPGYFNLSWANTRGYVYDDFYVQKNQTVQWDAPVIFQADEAQVNVNSTYSGSNQKDNMQKGTTARCLDVTEIVEKLYETRIARRYNGKGGTTLIAIKTWDFFQPEIGSDKSCENINKQTFHSTNVNGFLLNEGYNYPDLQGDLYSIPEIDSDGEKYKLKPCQVYYEINYNFPTLFSPEFNVTEKKEIDKQTGEEKVVGYIYDMFFEVSGNGINPFWKTIQTEEYNSSYIKGHEFNNIDQIIQFLKEISEGCGIKYEKKSNKKLAIISDYQVRFMNLSFLKIPDALFPVSDRVIQVSSFYNEFYPSCLQYQKQTGKGWKFDTYDDQEQFFVMDLLRGPLLIRQQDWRYKQGHIDYSNAYCPVESCRAHTLGCLVAANMYYKYFSGKSSSCPLCGASLIGAKGVSNETGDGIFTYFYDKPFDENSIITTLKTEGWLNEKDFNCNYKCYGRNSNRESWRLLNFYDKNTKTIFDCLNGDIARCRFVKVSCEPNMVMVYHEFQIKTYNDYQVVVKAPPGTDFTQLQEISFENLPIVIGNSLNGEEVLYEQWLEGVRLSSSSASSYSEQDLVIMDYCNGNDYGYPMKVVSGQVIGSNKDELKLNLSGSYPPKLINGEPAFTAEKLTHVQIFLKKYRGGIKTFRVFGANYKTEQGNDDIYNKINIGSQDKFLVMTDIQDEYIQKIDYEESKYRLTNVPIHIYSVYVGRGGEQIQLTQCDNINELKWTVEQKKVEYISNTTGKKSSVLIYKITGGKYFYDVNNGFIIIPKYATINNENIMATKFEQNLRGLPISTSYLPTHLIMRYVSGNGKSVKLKVYAEQHGPSYMVQKNAIRKIITKLEVPKDYKSCKILDVDNKVKKGVEIPWFCYNNVPATISLESQSKSNTHMQGAIINYNSGQFRLPSFGGGELNKVIQAKGKENIDQHFLDLFGPNATKCWGICESQVTLTGPPNQVLSGTITVEAPEISKTTINIGGGKKYTITEKTGGIKNGFIVVDCHPVQGERVTKCYNIPFLLIYACDQHEQDYSD